MSRSNVAVARTTGANASVRSVKLVPTGVFSSTDTIKYAAGMVGADPTAVRQRGLLMTDEEKAAAEVQKQRIAMLEEYQKAAAAHVALAAIAPALARARADDALNKAADRAVLAAIADAAAAKATPDGAPLLPNGLAPSSIYTIDRVVDAGAARLVRLREPPSTTSEWRGAFCRSSPAWTFELVFAASYSQEDDLRDKCFWMHFDDFLNHFQSLYVCRTFDDTRPGRSVNEPALYFPLGTVCLT